MVKAKITLSSAPEGLAAKSSAIVCLSRNQRIRSQGRSEILSLIRFVIESQPRNIQHVQLFHDALRQPFVPPMAGHRRQ